jgi:sugar phosphate isomerase/epimerase
MQDHSSMKKITRRGFIQRAALAAATTGALGAGSGSLLADTREESIKNYGGFRMGIQSYSLRAFGVEGALKMIEDLPLHWVEFFRGHYPVTPDKAKIQEMSDLLKKHDLSISAHGVQSFGKNEKANRNMFLFAKWAGIKNISANPTVESFSQLHDLVQEFDIRIAIHNHGPDALYDKAQQTLDAVQKWDKRIGFCADIGHYIRSGEDPVEVVNLLGERLYGVHLKDFAEQKKKTHGVILGKGHLDVEGVFRAMKKVKFPVDGALSLEYEESKDDPIAEIKECLAVASAAARRVASKG